MTMHTTTEEETLGLRRVQVRLLDAMKEICDKHGLKYWINFGTLLGALRYKGFIPWDDDIDVSMEMKDYLKFIEIAKKELPRDIFLQIPETDPPYNFCFAKLRDCYSTFLEHHETNNMGYHQGIYIDIFPFVRYPKMPRIIKKILLRTIVRSRDLAFMRKKNVIINAILYFSCKAIFALFIPFKSNLYGRTPEDNGYYEAIPYDVIFPLSEIEFEGKMYSSPNDVHEYLKLMYGKTYMTPPPEHKRVPHARSVMLDTPCNHPRAIKRD